MLLLNITKYESVFRIDFTGVYHAYEKYEALREMFNTLCDTLDYAGEEYAELEIRNWMQGPGGFVRPHTPYFVTLSKREHGIVMEMIREYHPEWYSRVRYYGRWI